MRRHLGHIGNNVNQVAKATNSGRRGGTPRRINGCAGARMPGGRARVRRMPGAPIHPSRSY
ncbi:plasmid mobilization relaxosome protein MobC [Streptomyces sp. NPDC001773]